MASSATATDVKQTLGPSAPRAEQVAAWRRLYRPMPADEVMSWVWTALITALAGILRFAYLDRPAGDKKPQIFDEIYYANDAWTVLHHGYETVKGGDGGAFVAHPPLGKWCIAIGEAMFGFTPFGWRFTAAIAGTLAVLIIIRLARRMFRSTLLGGVAGLLLALDGLELVQSRTALLDIFLMAFLLGAFTCLVLDRDHRRRTILARLEGGADATRRLPGRRATRTAGGALAALPWWRLAAAVCAGCALGVKWSAVYLIVVFVLMIFAWEVGLRRGAGVAHPFRDTFLDETGWILAFGGVLLATYLACWSGWFVTDGGYARNEWADKHHGQALPPIINELVNLFSYHRQVLNFHTNLSTPHQYQSWPSSWLLLGRPVAYAYSTDGMCGAAKCSAETLALGTPTLWWAFLPALAATCWHWISRRDWRGIAIFAGAAASIVPWFAYPERTMFYFYALPALPFLVLAVTLSLGLILGPATASRDRRLIGATIVAVYVVIVAVTFTFFWPIYTSEVITEGQWRLRMWLQTWI